MALQDEQLDPFLAWYQSMPVAPAPDLQVAAPEYGLPGSLSPIPSPVPQPPPPQKLGPGSLPPLPGPDNFEVPLATMSMPTPMPPEADAVSGAGPVPIQPEMLFQPETAMPSAVPDDEIQMDGQTDQDPGARMGRMVASEQLFEPRDAFETDGERLGTLSDVELQQEVAQSAEAKRRQGAADLLVAAHAEAKQAESDLQIFRQSREDAAQARAEVETEAKALAEEHAKPGDWYDEGGIGRTVGAMIAAALGGLVQHLNGGRNIGLEAVETKINRFLQAKQADLAQRRALINDKRQSVQAQAQDAEATFRESAAIRAASWERAIRLIDAEQQNYDPKGTTALRLEVVKREAIGRQQKALIEYEEATAKRMEAQGKTQLEIAKYLETQRKNTADIENDKIRARADQTRAGADYLRAKTDAKKAQNETQLLSPDYFAATYPGNDKPPHEMTRKQYADWVELSAKGPQAKAEALKAQSEGVVKAGAARLEGTGPGGSPYALGDQEGNPLVNKDGKVFEIKDDKQRQRATDIITAAQNVRRIADLVKIMRADTGGASSTVGSDEYQQLQSLASQIDFETFVGYGLGAPSEGDKALAENVRGGKDITSFIHDSSAGFEAYAKGLEEKATAQLRPLGYNGPAIKLKSIEAAQAIERSQKDNLDAWNSPLIENESVDPAIRKRAAKAAIESADALSKQAEPGVLKRLAIENQQRLAAGLIDKKEAEKAQKAFRREWKRKIAKLPPAEQARWTGGSTLGRMVGYPTKSLDPDDVAKDLDAQMLGPMPVGED
jgi:hypothetical protein